jgi:hypothetical protein
MGSPLDLPDSQLTKAADYVAAVAAELAEDLEDVEQCIHCLRFTYDPHTDCCWLCGKGLEV